MKKFIFCLSAFVTSLTACSSIMTHDEVIEAPVLSAYYSDWDSAVRADVDLQNMYIGTPSKITKPIDMYMAMALALKYNYSRRLASYQESLIKGNITPATLPRMTEVLGYDNMTNSSAIPSDLKVSWNMLDISSLYYQNNFVTADVLSEEQSRKVVNNILQEARSLYWKALAAQRLLPIIDDMNEYMVRVVDELNARTNELEKQGKTPSTNLLVKKRKYLDSIRNLTKLSRKFETAQAEFAGLLGLYPSTEIKLAGAEYGNFAIPSMRAKLQQLEWIALTNRPELKLFDAVTTKDELELIIKDFDESGGSDYAQDPNYYNRRWSKDSRDLSMSVFEEIRYPSAETHSSLARQRLSHIILNQVYLSWALYQSAVDDYLLNMGVASTSEDIAEDITSKEGANKAISQLESSRAIFDEVNAFLSYIDVQEAIGRLYATLGIDAVPADMLKDSPSVIAVQIRESFDKWRDGIFSNYSNGANISLSQKKPPVDISSRALVPNVTVGAGSDLNIKIPDEVFEQVNWNGPYKTVAGSLDDTGLPQWLKYDDATHTFSGHPLIDDEGSYKIKLYAIDKTGNAAVISFIITVDNLYVRTMDYKGLNGYRKAQVYHKCEVGQPCAKHDL